MKIICFAHAGGLASSFTCIKQYSSADIEIVPYEYSSRGTKWNQAKYQSFEQAVVQISSDIHKLVGNDRYSFFGHSMGAYVALFVAHRMQHVYKHSASNVFVSGQLPPKYHADTKSEELSNEEFVNSLVELGGMDERILSSAEILEFFLPAIRADYNMLDKMEIDGSHIKLNSPITVLYAKNDNSVKYSRLLKWTEHSLWQADIYQFEGDHFYIQNNAEKLFNIMKQTVNLEGRHEYSV